METMGGKKCTVAHKKIYCSMIIIIIIKVTFMSTQWK